MTMAPRRESFSAGPGERIGRSTNLRQPSFGQAELQQHLASFRRNNSNSNSNGNGNTDGNSNTGGNLNSSNNPQAYGGDDISCLRSRRERDPLQGPLTVLATHKVLRGHEREFEDWCQELLEEQSRFDGFHGMEVIRPTCCDDQEHITIFRYDTQEQVEAWMTSPERERLRDKAREFEEDDFQVRYHSLEFWFINDRPNDKDSSSSSGGGGSGNGGSSPSSPGPPPKWKMALVTYFVMWPSIRYVASLYFMVEALPQWVAQMFGVMTVVTLTTYVTMPIVTMYVVPWFLFPDMTKKRKKKTKRKKQQCTNGVPGGANRSMDGASDTHGTYESMDDGTGLHSNSHGHSHGPSSSNRSNDKLKVPRLNRGPDVESVSPCKKGDTFVGGKYSTVNENIDGEMMATVESGRAREPPTERTRLLIAASL